MNLPPYQSFPELKTERILLREVRQADILSLLEILTYDGKPAATLEEGIEITNRILQNYLDGDTINWLIEDMDTLEPAGFIGYYRGFESGVGELGFILKPKYRGLGLMSSALRLAVEFGMNEMKLNKVTAFTMPGNENAIAVLSRNGFSPEAELVETYLKFVYLPE
jgi:[ribosomal protein S5]-alanine N-acetyltransferase